MTAPIQLRLDQATRTAVSERYERTRNAVERTNCQMVLLADEGRHAQEIAWLVRRGPDQELRGQLVLVYTPAYDPESNRIEWLWRSFRRAVTHGHTRATLPPLLEDADTWADAGCHVGEESFEPRRLASSLSAVTNSKRACHRMS